MQCQEGCTQRIARARTVSDRKRADHIPANPANVDPANLHPTLPFVRDRVLHESNELAVRHAAEAVPHARVVADLNDAVLVDVPELQHRRVPSRVDARLRTCASPPRNGGGGAVQRHHFAHAGAEAVPSRLAARSREYGPRAGLLRYILHNTGGGLRRGRGMLQDLWEVWFVLEVWGERATRRVAEAVFPRHSDVW